MFPDGASTIAGEVDRLFAILHLVGGLAGLAVAVWIIYALIRYRASRNPQSPSTAADAVSSEVQPDESRRGLITTLIVSFLLLAATGIYSQIVWDRINAVPDRVVDTIRIAPRQFQWDVRYAGADGKFETADDPVWINRVVIPLGEPVRLELRSTDVIHSFFVPAFRIKRDAVPGSLSVVYVTPTEEGIYELACTEYCGLGHYRMRGEVEVMDRDAWVGWRDSTYRVWGERASGD